MKIVLAYDGSDYSKKALLYALKLMKEKDEIHVVTVVKEVPRSPEQVIVESETKAEKMLEEIKREIEGYSVKTKILEGSDVASALVEYCKKIECNMIVTGTRGLTGVKKAILGSVSSALVNKSDVPVLVIK